MVYLYTCRYIPKSVWSGIGKVHIIVFLPFYYYLEIEYTIHTSTKRVIIHVYTHHTFKQYVGIYTYVTSCVCDHKYVNFDPTK